MVVDPKKRATIEEIRTHPWLSKGYNASPASCLPKERDFQSIDQAIVQKVSDLGFDSQQVIEDIMCERHTKQTFVLYFLFFDKKCKEERSASPSDNERSRSPSLSLSPKAVHRNSIVMRDFSNSESEFLAIRTTRSHHVLTNSPSQTSMWRQSLRLEGDTKPNTDGWIDAKDSFKDNITVSQPASPVKVRPSPIRPSNPTPSPKSTRFGFLKIFKKESANASTSPPRSDQDQTFKNRITITDVNFTRSDDDSVDVERNLRTSRGRFNADTTTTKRVKDIRMELEKTFQTLGMTYTLNSIGTAYVVKQTDSKVVIEVEICKIAKLPGFRGIKLKRQTGDVWEYHRLIRTILTVLHL